MYYMQLSKLADRKGGFYKSEDMGESWSKQIGKVTSGNYYQEIFADPIDLGLSM